MYEQGLRPDDFRNDLKLWVPYHLLKCGDSDLEIEPPQPIADPDFEDSSNPSNYCIRLIGRRKREAEGKSSHSKSDFKDKITLHPLKLRHPRPRR